MGANKSYCRLFGEALGYAILALVPAFVAAQEAF